MLASLLLPQPWTPKEDNETDVASYDGEPFSSDTLARFGSVLAKVSGDKAERPEVVLLMLQRCDGRCSLLLLYDRLELLGSMLEIVRDALDSPRCGKASGAE